MSGYYGATTTTFFEMGLGKILVCDYFRSNAIELRLENLITRSSASRNERPDGGRSNIERSDPGRSGHCGRRSAGPGRTKISWRHRRSDNFWAMGDTRSRAARAREISTGPRRSYPGGPARSPEAGRRTASSRSGISSSWHTSSSAAARRLEACPGGTIDHRQWGFEGAIARRCARHARTNYGHRTWRRAGVKAVSATSQASIPTGGQQKASHRGDPPIHMRASSPQRRRRGLRRTGGPTAKVLRRIMRRAGHAPCREASVPRIPLMWRLVCRWMCAEMAGLFRSLVPGGRLLINRGRSSSRRTRFGRTRDRA